MSHGVLYTAEGIDDPILDAWLRYDKKYPEIWEEYERLTLEDIRAGHPRVAANWIFERMRRDCFVVMDYGEELFSLPNNFRPLYARKFRAFWPDLAHHVPIAPRHVERGT